MLCHILRARWAETLCFLHSRKWPFLLHDYIPHLGIFNLLRASVKVMEVVWLPHISWAKSRSNFKGYFFKCLLISESVGCSQVRDFQDFIHAPGRSNRLALVHICGCTAKVTLLRVITLHGHCGVYLFLQLCPFCSAVLAAGKDIAWKNSAKSSDEERDHHSFHSMPCEQNKKSSIYSVFFGNAKMQPMKNSRL